LIANAESGGSWTPVPVIMNTVFDAMVGRFRW